MYTITHFHSNCLQLVEALFVQKFKICLYRKVAEDQDYPDDLWMRDDLLLQNSFILPSAATEKGDIISSEENIRSGF